MDYLKISELAKKASETSGTISVFYRTIGANPQFNDATKNALYQSIHDMESEVKKIEEKIRKAVN